MNLQTARTPIQSEALPLDRATVVHLSVIRAGSGFELRVFPKRSGDTMVFHSESEELGAPEKPRQVRWLVTGLGEGQTVRISARVPESDMLPQDTYEITYPHNSVLSGEAVMHPGPGRDLTWGYTVSLLDAKRRVLDQIDPVVIIKNDP